MIMNGVLVIDKETGPTSHDIVSSVRKLLRQKKVGHTGTLDPAATGVLPLVLGKATKLSRYMAADSKRYHATIKLGFNTDTLDGDGEVVRERPVDVSEERLRAAVEKFVGPIEQLPPMYSAKKVDGKKLYELARKGIEVEREPKKVTIHSIDILDISLPELSLDVFCSSGTYLRVLAEDLGEALGCGVYLKALRRTSSGVFDLSHAVTLEELADDPDLAGERMLSLGEALSGFIQIRVPPRIGRAIASGHQLNVADLRGLDIPDFRSDELITLHLDDGPLIAIARSLVASDELSSCRRDRWALKTERVVGPPS